jgi:hypothetical protein
LILLPNKNTNPDLTCLAVSTFILKRLKSKKFEKYTILFELVKKNNKRSASLFVNALELLFMLDLINYHNKTDIIEYNGL